MEQKRISKWSNGQAGLWGGFIGDGHVFVVLPVLLFGVLMFVFAFGAGPSERLSGKSQEPVASFVVYRQGDEARGHHLKEGSLHVKKEFRKLLKDSGRDLRKVRKKAKAQKGGVGGALLKAFLIGLLIVSYLMLGAALIASVTVDFWLGGPIGSPRTLILLAGVFVFSIFIAFALPWVVNHVG
ncbi:MAG TPA: hypothetical protein ENJ88_03185 [Phaeodactylibacter sp.]|nr:hypothetical protein [Phaeodactylibacter sp.]